MILGAALLLGAAPAFAFPDRHDSSNKLAAPISGTCASGASAYSVSTDVQTTGSRTYRDVTGTSVSFTQGSSGCAEVSFSAEAAAVPGELMLTRVLFDGAKICAPADNILASDSPSGDLADHAMNYICGNVPAGNHTITLQFRSRFGHRVAIGYRTTIVRFTP
jgi:hypothetical protein